MADKSEDTGYAKAHAPRLDLIEGVAAVGIKIIHDESLSEEAKLKIALSLFKDIQREFGKSETEGVGGACVECTLARNACLSDPNSNHAQCWETFYSCTKTFCK